MPSDHHIPVYAHRFGRYGPESSRAALENLESWAEKHTAAEIDEGVIRDQKGDISEEHLLRLSRRP